MGIFGVILYLLAVAFIIYIVRKYFDSPWANNAIALNGKVIIVTGSSAGLGINTAQELLRLGARVIMANRNEEKTNRVIQSFGDNLNNNAVFMKLDLSSFQSIDAFAKEFSSTIGKFDILINNAGTIEDSFKRTENNIEQTFQANVLSNILLTLRLLDLMKPGGRVINVSSILHSMAKLNMKELLEDTNFDKTPNNFDGGMEYNKSKLGNVFFTQYLRNYIDKKKLNLTTVSLHPGAVKTDILRNFQGIKKILLMVIYPFLYLTFKSPLAGAQTTLYCTYLEDKEIINGGYYADCDNKNLGGLGNNDDYRKQYMEYCKLVMKKNHNNFPQNFEEFFA